MYSSNNIDALSLDVWGPVQAVQPLSQVHPYPIFLGGGAVFVKPGKGRPEVSLDPLRVVKYHNSFNVLI
jgi:hypothetical protein